MTDQAALERILAVLNDAMLDDAHWPAATALIDEACGLSGNALMVGEGPKEDVRVDFVGIYQRGQRREDFEREYLELYHPMDERVPRVRQLPECRLVHNRDLYTDEERKTSPVYNDLFRRARYQDSLAARLDGMDGSHMSLGLGDPVGRESWGSSRITLIERLLPHIRQFVRVRQVLGRARAYETTATGLLENRRIGVIHLDQRGLILAANDRARRILLRQDGLADRGGELCALAPADQPRLQRLVAAALPGGGAAPASGSMPLRRANGLPSLALHVKPERAPQPDYRAQRIAALVLLVEPERRRPVDPGLVADALGLTAGESRVAAWLAEGKRVSDMARDAGLSRRAIYWHLHQIYQKLEISRQADLVRLVLSVTELT